ncbi:hypothetical protein [Bradyrhizobium sp. ORS 111]
MTKRDCLTATGARNQKSRKQPHAKELAHAKGLAVAGFDKAT